MNNLVRFISKERLPLTFVIFYLVGLGLYIIPATRQLFIIITPYTLVLIAVAIFYHHAEWNLNTLIVLFSIFVASIGVEIFGVASGKLFGVYSYGTSLGYKIADVPVIIGLNWIILVYGSAAVISALTTSSILKIAGSSALMVVYDFVLEKAAPLMNMWKFEKGHPPFQNYIVWFVMAVFFHFAVNVFKLNTNNKPAAAVFIIQFFFFLIIVTYSLIFLQ